jgi:hypothetical protein
MKLIVTCPRGSLVSEAFVSRKATEAGPRRAGALPVRRRTWRAWAVPAVLIALCAVVGTLRDGGWTTTSARRTAGGESQVAERAGDPRARPRLVYPYSVVPGGVENGAEVAEALARDPIVAAHYAGFRADRARVVQLGEARLVHVSYRVKDKVYWTRKKVKLQKGEKLITDGKELIRARCGNRISDAPMAGVALIDPPEVSSDTPLLPLPLVALAKPIEAPAGAPEPVVEEPGTQPAPIAPPVVPAGRTGFVPIVVPFGGGGGGVIPPGSTPPGSGSPVGVPAGGGTPPGTPSVTPPAPGAEPPAQPPSAPPPTTPGNPPSGGGTPPPAPPSNPPSTPSTEPPATPPGTPAVPPGTQPPPPAPVTPSVTPPGSVPPAVTPPTGTPPGPTEPPLPGFPPVPDGITPPGPGPTPPPDVSPPPGAPNPKPEPPPLTPVPEPSTYLLIGCGLAGIALLKRRHSRG